MKEKRITLILSIALAVCAGATIPTLISSIPPVEPYSVNLKYPIVSPRQVFPSRLLLTAKPLTCAGMTAVNGWTGK